MVQLLLEHGADSAIEGKELIWEDGDEEDDGGEGMGQLRVVKQLSSTDILDKHPPSESKERLREMLAQAAAAEGAARVACLSDKRTPKQLWQQIIPLLRADLRKDPKLAQVAEARSGVCYQVCLCEPPAPSGAHTEILCIHCGQAIRHSQKSCSLSGAPFDTLGGFSSGLLEPYVCEQLLAHLWSACA